MQSKALILLLLTWSSAVSRTAAEEPQALSGQKILKKQKECDQHISKAIDAIIESSNPSPHDIPSADHIYHDCKKELDKLKREYITTFNIDRTSNTEFFPVKVNEKSTELIPVPAVEGAEPNYVEFDVTEELCVTSNKCSDILGLMEKYKEQENEYNKRFAHCHILLDEIKQKYVQYKKLDEKKLKDEGGLSVQCPGKQLKMQLPEFMNRLGYSSPGDVLSASTTQLATPTIPQSVDVPGKNIQEQPKPSPPVNEKHEHHAEHKPETTKGVKSNAFVDRANAISCALIMFVVFKIM